ncbi:tRNA pseudouridine(55) synthase TruB [Ferruginivarius sediminum]|uniref:tRNA pseudouridine synthase B n=1 Tax=Ferruginivarius sediminum TaxID=2661937 RepID=A0A369TG17_9PROT|nr:tRNA pseudouridine(55) synthase TruB [Ferruginivarius sediminum]RDD63335.1 tRNA pseudouridine(55) synthase TruB [Ferruginivarius sediminum]
MSNKRKKNRINGWIALDKPLGITSTQAVNRVKAVLNPQKIGHGGTLDPLASGVLPIALGEATKTVAYMMEATKTYRFTLRWGQATETDDAEGAVTETSDRRPTQGEIEAALPGFLGVIEQMPPAYSAIKVNGQRAYDIARGGGTPELQARPVRIDTLELLSIDDDDHASFTCTCGKGFYIRALARDLGAALGVPAHLAALRRTRVGGFGEDDMISLETLESLGHSAGASEYVLPVETALDDIPALALTDTEANRLRSGQSVSLLKRSNLERLRDLENGDVVCAMTGGRAVALARFESGDIRPVRVLNL